MNTPYGIFEYQIDSLSSYIAYQTNTNFAFVKQKYQMLYLDNYILNFIDKDDAEHSIVFVYENEYIDKHYIEDYTTYYARCFKEYRKSTSRVHFFKIKKTIEYKKLLRNTLEGNETDLNNENYLGFVVIRPIPKTFLAKVCLKPYYDNVCSRLTKYYITTKYDVSLFGISLNIKTIAFQEQDKVLSACATTALWTFFHAHGNLSQLSLPSSSSITKNAYPDQNGHSREFPNVGLSTEMICRGLRSCNLVPEYFEFSKTESPRINLLKELIFAYCSSGFPLILGIEVCDIKGKSKGLHAVTILGYSVGENIEGSELYSHEIDKLYIHDDRYGPFLMIEFKDNAFSVRLNKNLQVTTEQSFDEEIYRPDTLIMGLYHKIRIPYMSIRSTCILLNKNIIAMLDNIKDTTFLEEIKMLKSIKWDISIIENSDLKNKIINNPTILEKEYTLTQPWPKYIWNAKIMIENNCEFELLFDATDIEQSNVFLGCIVYDSDESVSIYELLVSYCKSTTSYHIKEQNFDYFNTEQDNFLYGVKEYFTKNDSGKDSMNELYGYLKIPEYIKTEEIKEDLIINNLETRLNCENDSNKFNLNKALSENLQYIWLIDQEGFLCIGTETKGSNQGHPTLTNGMPARIGGELSFNDDVWTINSRSGRYSTEYEEPDRIKYVNNARKYKFEVFFPSEKFINNQQE